MVAIDRVLFYSSVTHMTQFRTMDARKAFLGACFVCVVAVVCLVSAHRAKSGSSDFDVYYNAGKAVMSGEPLYTVSRHAVNRSKSPYVYPPFFAFFMVGFSQLPVQAAACLWNLFSLAAFAGSLMLIHRLVVGDASPQFWWSKEARPWTLFFSALALMVLADNLAMAQVNGFVLLLTLLGLNHVKHSRDTAGGFWIGVASAVKIIPALFFLYFLLRGRWRTLWGGFMALAACLVLVPILSVGFGRMTDLNRSWFQETVRDHATPRTLGFYSSQLNPSHQDLRATVFRWIIDWEFRERTGGPNGRAVVFRTPIRLTEIRAGQAANAAAALILVLFIAALARLSSTAETDPSHLLKAACLVLTAMVLISPKVRSHFFAFLWLPWAVLVYRISRESGRKPAAMRTASVGLVSGALYLAQGVRYLKFLGAGCYSALVLFLYFFFDAFRRNNTES